MSHTIKQIADRAGVSKSTVSRIISGKGYASPEAREKVMDIIGELGYKPNAVARAMVAQRTNNIGVIVFRQHRPVVSHPLYGKMLDAILEAAGALGYSVFVTTDQEMSLRSTDYLLEKRVDGLILISRLRQNVLDDVKKFGVPYLMVNGTTDDPDVVQIVSRDGEGGAQAADCLYRLGHRRIAVMAGPQEHRSHNLRLKGFCGRLASLGCPVAESAVIHSPQSTFEDGRRLASEHGERLHAAGCTALFATNDMLALGAMKRLLELGFAVPEQLSVMGFDDIDFAGMYAPSLTTIRIDKAGMGTEAVKLLDRLIRQEDVGRLTREFGTELLERESTRAR